MNDFDLNPNMFNCNPFDKPAYEPSETPTEMGITFNEWLLGSGPLNCIVENMFFKDRSFDKDKGAVPTFAQVMNSCRYLVCAASGFYGLESNWG